MLEGRHSLHGLFWWSFGSPDHSTLVGVLLSLFSIKTHSLCVQKIHPLGRKVWGRRIARLRTWFESNRLKNFGVIIPTIIRSNQSNSDSEGRILLGPVELNASASTCTTLKSWTTGGIQTQSLAYRLQFSYHWTELMRRIPRDAEVMGVAKPTPKTQNSAIHYLIIHFDTTSIETFRTISLVPLSICMS